jgi:hypothetical protein
MRVLAQAVGSLPQARARGYLDQGRALREGVIRPAVLAGHIDSVSTVSHSEGRTRYAHGRMGLGSVGGKIVEIDCFVDPERLPRLNLDGSY